MVISALGGPTASSGIKQQIDEPLLEGGRVSDERGLGVGLGWGLTKGLLAGLLTDLSPEELAPTEEMSN